MKKAIPIILFLCILFVAFSTTAHGEEEEQRDYLITQKESIYSLYEYREGTPVLIRSGSLRETVSALSSGRVILEDLHSTEDLELPKGSLVFSGKLSLSAGARLSVPEGTSLTLSKAELIFTDNSLLRIKGGSVVTEDSVIKGEGTAIRLDYSVFSSLLINSGSIFSSSEAPTLDISMGSATVLSGSIENASGIAISNSSSLFLSGSPIIGGVGTDIETSVGITISKSGEFYSPRDKIRIKYKGEFEKGRLKELFYSASPDQAEKLTLLSASGREYPLTYFNTSVHTDESRFLGVYLPYSVKIYDGGILISDQNKLLGEQLDNIEPPKKLGYSFCGIYKDEALSEPFSADERIKEDTRLYLGYKLDSPSFTVSSLAFSYDGSERELGFSSIYHPLLEKGGFFTYKWYKNGELVAESASVRLREVRDSGSYSCALTFNYLSDKISVTAEGIRAEIEKCELKPPEIMSSEYTGKSQSPDIALSPLYTFNAEPYINKGKYELELTLTDSENYCWENDEGDTVTVYFEITKATNRFTSELTVQNSYFGTPLKLLAEPLFGRVEYIYSSTLNGDYKPIPPTTPGIYYVKARVEDNENYTALISEPREFRILPEYAVALSVAADAEQRSYRSFDSFSPAGLTIRVSYNSGREEILGLDKISFKYQNGNSFLYGDTGVIIFYEDVSLVYSVEVRKSEYDLSALELSDYSVMYDGSYHTFEYKGAPILGKDGIPLTVIADGGGTDSGIYEIVLSFHTDSKEYLPPPVQRINMTVLRREVSLVYENTVFIYDKAPHLPKAYYIDVFGVKRYPELIGANINAGENYLAKVDKIDRNYQPTNPEIEYSIKKADYNFSSVIFSAEEFIYDGEEKTVTVSGLPEGVLAVGYTDNSYTESGSYTLTVSLSYDTENYNPPKALTHNWRIFPAEYDMSTITFKDSVSEFDGKEHFPKVEGTLPTGIDGSRPSYSFTRGVTNVREGRAEVRVIFESGSKNYNAPSSLTLYVEILPKGIEVVWSQSEFIYSGKPQHPTAASEESVIKITGAATDAGNYIAEAVAEDRNYYVINNKREFTVKKADNYFTLALRIENIFEGRLPSPISEAYFGEIIYSYYTDGNCLERIDDPLTPGKYYCVAEVRESGNYNPLVSPPMAFEVIKVVPVRIEAEITDNKLCAFEKLGEKDLSVIIYYNDQSETIATEDQLTVVYQNGDSLRKKDTKVYIYCLGIEVSLEISVDFATYDLSNISWSANEAVYDGELKLPTLSGLPDGVSVKEYKGGGINAGSYIIEAVLDYDSENYNKPEPAPFAFTVKKQAVKAPAFEPILYSGIAVYPKTGSELYTLSYDGEIKNAGDYKLTLTLTDPENYTFDNGSREEVFYKVLPIVLTLSVSDLDLYLFSKVEMPEYKITSGSLIAGDTLELGSVVEGDTVRLYSQNPNYTLEGNIGGINRIDRLHPRTLELIMLYLLLSLLLILLGVILLLNRDRIRLRLAYYKEQRSKKRLPPSYVLMPGGTLQRLPEPRSDSIDDPEKASDDDIVLSDDPMTVDAYHADELISDSLAKDLLKRSREAVYTTGYKKEIINVDTLNEVFSGGDKIDVNILKEKGLVDEDTAYIKVLARGEMNKALSIYANDFSLSAIKMIALTGGEAIKVITIKTSEKKSI